MKKPRHFIGKSSFHKDFGDAFVHLAERHGRHEVWSDFITMSACAISNASDTRFQQEREALYMASVKRYTQELKLNPLLQCNNQISVLRSFHEVKVLDSLFHFFLGFENRFLDIFF